ncbi:MAG: S-layer homology domain-containing protein [Vallitaleaceae bacterium]|nr:S-layer homology domain-containing protein [Vallitaleaceae bacterium]
MTNYVWNKLGSKSIAAIIGIVMLITIIYQPMNAFASTMPRYEAVADYLNELGLFNGGNNGYDLDLAPDRSQGAVMVVRLLGKESEAMQMNYAHPFTDVPNWASPYVGYLYHEGITNGVRSNTYGAEDLLDEAQYMTLMLRVLKYSDANGDFDWRTSLDKAYEIGLLTVEQYTHYLENPNDFIRDDMVLFSYKVLFMPLNAESSTLYEQLVLESAISPVGSLTTGDQELDQAVVPPTTTDAIKSSQIDYPYTGLTVPHKVTTNAELQLAIETAIFNMQTKVTFDVTNITDYAAIIGAAIDNIKNYPGYFSMISGYGYVYQGGVLTLELDYYLSITEVMAARAKADTIIAQIITSGMTEYERELAIHDYLVDNVVYVTNIAAGNNNPYTMYGAFIDGLAVCQGYAVAFDYLCELAGIDARIITGIADQNGSLINHAWNMVKINGLYYQIDVTWDDPVTADGSNTKTYYYFNITDSEMDMNHNWTEAGLPSCDATIDNYYNHNSLIISSETALKSYLRSSLLNKETSIQIKVTGFNVTATYMNTLLQNNEDTKWANCSIMVHEGFDIIEITDITYWN